MEWNKRRSRRRPDRKRTEPEKEEGEDKEGRDSRQYGQPRITVISSDLAHEPFFFF